MYVDKTRFVWKLGGGTAAEALAQIKAKGYAAPYARSGKAVTAVGAGFSERERTIAEWVKEMINAPGSNAAEARVCALPTDHSSG